MSADRNLLFGILAVQMDFVTRDQLIAGMNAWVLEKSKPLGEILHQQGSLADGRRTLLEALVNEHLAQHNNDPQQSLAAVSSIKSVRQDLEQLADSDVAASLVHVSQQSEVDPFATRAATAGDATSSGTRFRILRPHAKGGLGKVSVALDAELHREVALKEIKEEHAHRNDSRGRFLVEAEVTGGLEHPGIVPVYGLGTYADGRPYYAMRFIRGDSLKSAIESFHQTDWKGKDSERSLALRKLLGRFVDVCNAIAYAHSRGVLHRDLKPGNIMLGNYGETLVVDWGLARVQDRTEELDSAQAPLQLSSGSNSGQTVAGAAIGTPGYMSPEQAEGRLDLLGPATDVYSLGATLYNLLTGQPPIESNQVDEVLARTIKGNIKPLHEIDGRIPKPVAAICEKAMALQPQQRYPTPNELADDVEKYLADEPVSVLRETVSARIARVSRKHRGVVQTTVAALLLLTLLSFGAVIWINSERSKAEEAAEGERIARIDEGKQKKLAQANERRAQQQERIARGEAALAELDQIAANVARVNAERQRILAEQREAETQQQLYYSKISRAAAHLESNRYGQAADVLNSIPFDQRKWEAHYLSRRAEGTPLTLHWNTNRVNSVGFSPDSSRIVAGGADGTVRVWDAVTGTETHTLRVDTREVTSVGFSPDGSQIVSGDAAGTVRVWDADKGTETLALRGHTSGVNCLAFSPDGSRIVSGSGPWGTGSHARLGQIKVWDVASGTELHTLYGHTEHVSSVSFSPDGSRIVSGGGCPGKSAEIKVWDAATGIEIHELRGHTILVTSVAFSPDGTRIVSGSWDTTVKVWDAAKGAEIRTFRGHNGFVDSVAFSPDGSQIVSGSNDNTVKVWDLYSGTEILTFRGHTEDVGSVAFSSDGTQIVSGSGYSHKLGEVKVWNVAMGTERHTLRGHAELVNSVAFSPDASRIASGSGKYGKPGEIKVWNTATGDEINTLHGHTDRVTSVAFSVDGSRIVSGSLDESVKVWDAQKGVNTTLLTNHHHCLHLKLRFRACFPCV